MHPALLKLIGLRVKAWFRRFATRGSLARRILGAIVFAYFLISWVASIIFTAVSRDAPQVDPALVLQAAPLVLALITAVRLATVASSHAIEFTPAEMDLLFPGPFTRRQLLTFKIALGSFGSLIIAVFLSASLSRLGASWLSAYLALLCALLLIQLVGTLAALARQRLGQSGFGRVTLALVAIVILAAAIAVVPAIRETSVSDPVEILRTIAARTHASPIARAVLSPFELPARVLVAPSGLPLLGWLGATVGMLALILSAIFRMDSAYTEAAIAASSRSAARLDRARRSGSVYLARSSTLRIPTLPRLAGAGPVAWRQLTTAARAWRNLTVLALVIAGMLVFTRWLAGDTVGGAVVMIPIAFPLYILLSSTVQFDFRTDINHIDTLKFLPLRPTAVVAGQLATPVLLLSTAAIISGLFLALAIPNLDPAVRRWAFPTTLLCAIPLALTVVAIDNAVFLLMPTSRPTGSAADSNLMLRQIVRGMFRFLLLTCAAILAGLVTTLAWVVTHTILVTLLLTAGALTALGLGAGAWLSFLFQRFDPSRDAPA
ncbi:MAG: hypothetical protein IT431_17410 [Phycisphaerales bacterium]|nr:hypothetical protein [Phycisphaerales bacterium]